MTYVRTATITAPHQLDIRDADLPKPPPDDVSAGARLWRPLGRPRRPPGNDAPVDLAVTELGIVLGTYEPAGPVRHGQM